MKDKDLAIILIAVLILAGLYVFNQKPKPLGLTIHYYDSQKNEIKRGFLGSTISPPGVEASFIAFDIIGSNTGESPIRDMKIIDASPAELKDSLPTTIQSLAVGESKTLWSSDLINTTLLEVYPQPVRFWVNVSGIDEYSNKIIYSQDYQDISITPSSFLFSIWGSSSGNCLNPEDGNSWKQLASHTVAPDEVKDFVLIVIEYWVYDPGKVMTLSIDGTEIKRWSDFPGKVSSIQYYSSFSYLYEPTATQKTNGFTITVSGVNNGAVAGVPTLCVNDLIVVGN